MFSLPPASHWRLLALACLLPVALLLSGCDDESLMTPTPDGGERFARYVALGNSITAGFQSDGINATLQQQSYANLLAGQMGTRFEIPALNDPGCPPPLVQVFPAPQRAADVDCALRESPPPTEINNVAVPGAEVIDAFNNLDDDSNANPLTTFILGGRTQVEVATEIDPTFATVWLGNNDVLLAAVRGNTGLITDTDAFTQRYGQVLDDLEAGSSLEGGVLIGVSDPTIVPALSAGAAYYNVFETQDLDAATPALPSNFSVDSSCIDPTGRGATHLSFTFGATLIQIAAGLAAQTPDGMTSPTVTLACDEDRSLEDLVALTFGGDPGNIPPPIAAVIAETGNPSLLVPSEIVTVRQATAAYNAFIEAQANEHGYVYVDPNELFEANESLIPAFPDLLNNPDQPFGPLFSLDGVHPSAAAHVAVTNALVEAINGAYDANLQPVPTN